MQLVRLHFEVAGVGEYVRSFTVYAHEADDMREPFGDIADIIIESVQEQFTTEGAHGGIRWAPLEPGYRLWKEHNYPGRPILVQTGVMRRAATDKQRTVTITPKRLLYEVHDDKAYWHQTGAGHLPERRLVNLTLAERRQWDRVFAHWLNDIRRGPIGARLPGEASSRV